MLAILVVLIGFLLVFTGMVLGAGVAGGWWALAQLAPRISPPKEEQIVACAILGAIVIFSGGTILLVIYGF